MTSITFHILLIFISAFGTVLVMWGIIKESWHADRRVAAIIILGTAIEFGCTLGLLLYDESISRKQEQLIRADTETIAKLDSIVRDQKDKIIGLETRIAPRVITEGQYRALAQLRGHIKNVAFIASPDAEPAMFAAQLEVPLVDAGVTVHPIPAPSGDRWVGTSICFSNAREARKAPRYGAPFPRLIPMWACVISARP
jgi:hypothetical protein